MDKNNKEKSISILTITLNNEIFMKDYFTSIFQGSRTPIEVLVYDAGSTDKTIETIKSYQKKYPGIRLIEAGNIGFAAGNNLLAEKAVGEFLFILNPDTRIDVDCLRYLVENPANHNSIVIPKQFLFSKKFLHHGVGMDIFGYPVNAKLFYADGAAIFLKAEVFKSLGMFDDDYFMFQEDIDLSWRAHLYGVKLVLEPKAFLFHYSGGSIKGGAKTENKKYVTNIFRRYYGERNIIINILKNYSLLMILIIMPIYLLINFFEILLFAATLNFKACGVYFRAYYWIITNCKKIYKKRQIVQKNRIVSDWQILKDIYIGSSKLKFLFQVGIPNIK